MVLLTALATTPVTPDCHKHGCCGCHGYYSCHGCYSCYGCYGCTGCYGGGCYGCYGGGVMMPGPGTAPPPPPKKMEKMEDKEGGAAAAATVVVELPADARLFVENQPTHATSTVRTFVTPALNPEKAYYYTVRAELNRGGETYTKTQRIAVEAGKTSRVSFTDLASADYKRTLVAAGR
jgi:uncharacterized protein (TIGR03000 family)